MLAWSINLFRVRGIQLTLHSSFVLLLVYVGYQGYELGGRPGIVWATVLLLTFFTCIVLHELGHSFTAQHYGVKIQRIVLMPIGGMAQFDMIPKEPRKELWITIAGPAVNFAIAAVLIPIFGSAADQSAVDLPTSLPELACVLGWWNLWIGLFNLVPVFPMDGGRILRALLAMKLPYVRATFWAATVGKVLAVVGIGASLWWQAYLPAALFIFIFVVGEAEYRVLKRREREEADWKHMLAQYQAVPEEDEPPFLAK